MFKREKNLNTAVNTEIDQALAVINFTEFTKIDRPKKDKSHLKIFSLVFLLVLLPVAWLYFIREGSGLVNYLPADTKFYVSLSLPQEIKWFSPLFFWRADAAGGKPSQKLASIYSRLNLISWDKAAWAEKILPLLSGRIELASLPRVGGTPLSPPLRRAGGGQAEGGGVLLKTRLKDKSAWLGLFGATLASYQGEVVSQDLAVSGAWKALTKNPNKIAWQILGNDLYIADSADVLFELNGKIGNSLAAELKKMKVKTGLALFYAKDKDSLPLDNAYIKAFSSAAIYPLAMSFTQARGAVNINIYGQKSNLEPAKSTILASRLYEFDNSFYAQNLALAYSQAEAYLPEGLKNNFWGILKDFYGITKDEALTEIGQAEIFFTFSGSDWLLNIANNTGENKNLLDLLKKGGATMFASTHPAAVERSLADGTKMVELRAETAGLEWGEEPWSYASQAVKLASLKGQGEISGYYVGFVPEIGYILTTAMPLLNQYANNKGGESGEINKTGCDISDNMLIGASVPVAGLTNDAWWRARAKKIIIFFPEQDKISGCALLLE